MIVVDEEAFRRLPGSIALHRAGLALLRATWLGPRPTPRRALELAAEDDHVGRGAHCAPGPRRLDEWGSRAALRRYAEGMASWRRPGTLDLVAGAINLADIRIAQGRLRDAMQHYEHGVQLATEQGGPVLRGTADMYVGISELQRERNDLEAARSTC